jgi:hypothetical protein
LLDDLYRAFTVSGRLKPEEAVQATLSSLPDEVVDTIQVTSLPSEDSVSERQRKLVFLEKQEELIKVKYGIALLFKRSFCFIRMTKLFSHQFLIFAFIRVTRTCKKY